MNASGFITSTSTSAPQTTSSPTQPFPEHISDQQGSGTLGYIFVSVAAIAVVVASVLVVLLVRKSRINRLRHHLMPLYNFDGTDDQEEWEAELLDDISESHSLRRGYKSMEFPSSRSTASFS